MQQENEDILSMSHLVLSSVVAKVHFHMMFLFCSWLFSETGASTGENVTSLQASSLAPSR